MTESNLLHELVSVAAERSPDAPALSYGKAAIDYAQLQSGVSAFASGLRALGLQRWERVGIWLEKRIETVIASFGAPCAGGVFVPMNPLLKPEQVAFIAQDCNVRVLVTSPDRLPLLLPVFRRKRPAGPKPIPNLKLTLTCGSLFFSPSLKNCIVK